MGLASAGQEPVLDLDICPRQCPESLKEPLKVISLPSPLPYINLPSPCDPSLLLDPKRTAMSNPSQEPGTPLVLSAKLLSEEYIPLILPRRPRQSSNGKRR